MSQNQNKTGGLGNKSQDSEQNVKIAGSAGDFHYASSDQTLENTIAAMDLLEAEED
jgi:hypothetical protein